MDQFITYHYLTQLLEILFNLHMSVPSFEVCYKTMLYRRLPLKVIVVTFLFESVHP